MIKRNKLGQFIKGNLSANYKGGKIKKICLMCGKEFEVYPYRKNTAKYCSQKCSQTSEITRRKISEAQKGEKGYNWQGGINLINDTIRKSIEYKLWREAVFARDNWTCQKTGKLK